MFDGFRTRGGKVQPKGAQTSVTKPIKREPEKGKRSSEDSSSNWKLEMPVAPILILSRRSCSSFERLSLSLNVQDWFSKGVQGRRSNKK